MPSVSDLLAASAAKWGISLNLLTAVAQRESSFNPFAVSSAGAQGVMQLMPVTATQYGVSDPFDAAQNVDAGAHLLSDLLKRYNGNTALALAAYNAGPGNVSKYGGIPPFPETQSYVNRILSDTGQQNMYASEVSKWSAGDSSGWLDTGTSEDVGGSELSGGAIAALALGGAALLVVLLS